MAFGIVRTDKMHGTVSGGPDLASLRYKASGVNADIQNGSFVVAGALEAGEREVRVATAPAANTEIGNLYLIASEEVDKSKKFDVLDEFCNKAGDICRGYRLNSHDEFSLTADCFTVASGVTPTAGTSVLNAVAGIKFSVANAAVASTTTVADLIAIEDEGMTKWYVFRVR